MSMCVDSTIMPFGLSEVSCSFYEGGTTSYSYSFFPQQIESNLSISPNIEGNLALENDFTTGISDESHEYNSSDMIMISGKYNKIFNGMENVLTQTLYQTYYDCIIDLLKEQIWEEVEMKNEINFVKLFNQFPVSIKIHLVWILIGSLFMLVVGILDLTGITLFGIKFIYGLLFCLLILAQSLFYIIKPDRWFFE